MQDIDSTGLRRRVAPVPAPRFDSKRLDQIKRNDIKVVISELVANGLARSSEKCTQRNRWSVQSGNRGWSVGIDCPLGRFTRAAKSIKPKGLALTVEEVAQLLSAASVICPRYKAPFLTAVRAGLRRGELVALEWGDIEFGHDDEDPHRFILVQHNYVLREHTTTKSKKPRRVDMSRELRCALIERRNERALAARLEGKPDITEELVFPSPEGCILDPDNLYSRYFVPVLEKSGIRRIRLHDLRHTFGSLLIQSGASIVYVKNQMGHSSIQLR